MRFQLARWGAVCLAASLCIHCGRGTDAQSDHPQASPNVRWQDVKFRSAALGREMQYRVMLPTRIEADRLLPVVYLLHGGAGSYRDWSNYSDVWRNAESGLILVMPQGDDSYYVNAVGRPADRYEGYVIHDLIADVEARFPAARDRGHRAIAGVSMGGFGAIKLAFSYPERFAFAGALSPAIDVPRRAFSFRRAQQYWSHRSVFGPWGSSARRNRDPFAMAQSVDTAQMPYLFLTCGDREGLLAPNRDFAAVLLRRRIAHEFHVVHGGHEWRQWSDQVPALVASIRTHLSRN